MIRRNFILGAAALAATTPTLVACSSSANHEEIARNLRRSGDVNARDQAQLLRELVRYAFLNQPVEVVSIRPQFAAALGLGKRRPVQSVLV